MFKSSLVVSAFALAAVMLSPMVVPSTAEAGARSAKAGTPKVYRRSATRNRSYRRRPQVRGYLARRGGYSFTALDTINTTSSTGRSYFGSTNSYRDPSLDRQTTSGPFDHGFFFNSATAPRGGDSPYHQ